METQEQRSDNIIRKHVLLAAGAGLIPVPLADLAAVTGIQVAMLSELSENYKVSFAKNQAKIVVSSMLGSIASREVATLGVSTMLKAIPGVGSLLGAVSMPLASGALTYAMGVTFKIHFSRGGNFGNLSFDSVREDFRRRIDEGKRFVESLREESSSTPSKIYCILKPNIGKYGKVYLKTYVDGIRPEKYIGTIDELKIRYGVENLEAVKDRIIEDHREMFLRFVGEATKPAVSFEAEAAK